VLSSISSIAEVTGTAAASSEEVSASTQEQLSAQEELTHMAAMLNQYSASLNESLEYFNV